MFRGKPKKLHLNPYLKKTRRRKAELKRGLFRKRRTLISPKIYLPTQRLHSRDSSAGIQRKVFFFLFLIGIGTLFYLLFFFPFWEIKKITVLGTQNIDPQEIEQKAREGLGGRLWYIFPKRNLILTPRQEIAASLSEEFAQIATVSVVKEFPDVLKVDVSEKKPVAIWVTGATRDLFLPPEAFITDTQPGQETGEGSETTPLEEMGEGSETEPVLELTTLDYPENPKIAYYYLNEEGTVGDEISQEQVFGEDLPLLYNQSFQEVVPHESILTPEFLIFMFVLRDLLPLKTNLKIHAYIVPIAQSRDLFIKVDQGFQIFFDTEQYIQNQINALQTILKEPVEQTGQGVKYYVDLRVEGLAFYK